MDKADIVVFIAKDSKELQRYPGILDGFSIGQGLTEYRFCKDGQHEILILPSGIKDKFKWENIEDAMYIARFAGAIAKFCKSAFDIESEFLYNYKNASKDKKYLKNIVVFTHWGKGGGHEFIADQEKKLLNKCRDHGGLNTLIPNWTFYSLSSQRNDLFDVSGQIHIPKGDDLERLIEIYEKYTSIDYARRNVLKTLAIKLRSIKDNPSQNVTFIPVEEKILNVLQSWITSKEKDTVTLDDSLTNVLKDVVAIEKKKETTKKSIDEAQENTEDNLQTTFEFCPELATQLFELIKNSKELSNA